MEAVALSQNMSYSATITVISGDISEWVNSAKIGLNNQHPHLPSFQHLTLSSLYTTNSHGACATLDIWTANPICMRWNIAETFPHTRAAEPSVRHRRHPRMFFRTANCSQLLFVLYSSFVVREADLHSKLVEAGRVLAGARRVTTQKHNTKRAGGRWRSWQEGEDRVCDLSYDRQILPFALTLMEGFSIHGKNRYKALQISPQRHAHL